jgi:hypothetical protein
LVRSLSFEVIGFFQILKNSRSTKLIPIQTVIFLNILTKAFAEADWTGALGI